MPASSSRSGQNGWSAISILQRKVVTRKTTKAALETHHLRIESGYESEACGWPAFSTVRRQICKGTQPETSHHEPNVQERSRHCKQGADIGCLDTRARFVHEQKDRSHV